MAPVSIADTEKKGGKSKEQGIKENFGMKCNIFSPFLKKKKKENPAAENYKTEKSCLSLFLVVECDESWVRKYCK